MGPTTLCVSAKPGSTSPSSVLNFYLDTLFFVVTELVNLAGGVLIAIKYNIQAIHRPDLEGENIELDVVEIINPNSKSIILYTFYRPPDSESDVLTRLNLSLLSTPESSRIILIGDLTYLP